jgi:hypothetical protein
MVTIPVADYADHGYCVDPADGDRLYQVVAAEVAASHRVVLDLSGVHDLTSGFVNAAVGRLYGDSDAAVLDGLLGVAGGTETQRFVWRRSIERAQAYFADRARFERVERELVSAHAA